MSMQGNYLCGRLLGVQSTPWKNDPSKFNHRIGVAVDTVNDWGEPVTETKTADVQHNDLQRLQSFATANKGKMVAIPVGINCRELKRDGVINKAWVSMWVPNGAEVLVFEAAKSSVKAAS